MDCLRNDFTEGTLLNRRYETIAPLNHGSFGMVFVARDLTTGNRVAIKCLTKPSAAQDVNFPLIVDDKSEELAIHSRAGSHPNIVNLIESFETETHTYLVLEYCSMGDLYEAIRQDKGPKKTDHVRDFMLQLVGAIQYLHSRGLYHRDIKPENIFLTENGDMKLGDFGLATSDAWSYEAAVGSDRYMAPEQYDPAGSGLSPAKADIWSVGICLLNILFSRNPFGCPSIQDPLFTDFVRDRQSLFDVFPNMSQDTFEVLTYCLALDPQKRSLFMVREALERVVSFTTDDESLDEFCTDDGVVPTVATANREPLRTPSINSPNMGGSDAFPWAKALNITSPRKGTVAMGRTLSVIPDTDTPSEDLFPGSEASTQDWFSKADTQSIESAVDSGLGVSISSSNYNATSPKSVNVARSKPVAIAASLPSLRGSASSALASIFGGKKKAFESKSWSELWDEEEEEREMEEQAKKQQERSIDASSKEHTVYHPSALSRPPMRAMQSKLSNLNQEDSEDDGRSTPRAVLRELRQPMSMGNLRYNNLSQDSIFSVEDELFPTDARVSEQTGFVFEEHASAGSPSPSEEENNATPRYASPQPEKQQSTDVPAAVTAATVAMAAATATTATTNPAKKSSFMDKLSLDKWAALGDKRRGAPKEAPMPTPKEIPATPVKEVKEVKDVKEVKVIKEVKETEPKADVITREMSMPADSTTRRAFRASNWRRGMFNRQPTTSLTTNNAQADAQFSYVPQNYTHFHHSNYHHGKDKYNHNKENGGAGLGRTLEWSLSKDWRKSEHHLPLTSSVSHAALRQSAIPKTLPALPPLPLLDQSKPHPSQLDGASLSSSTSVASTNTSPVSTSSTFAPSSYSPSSSINEAISMSKHKGSGSGPSGVGAKSGPQSISGVEEADFVGGWRELHI